MQLSFEIRPVCREDFAGWLQLWDGYNAFYGRAGSTALPLSVSELTWSRFFDAYEPMHALVAQGAGKLLGLVHFLYHRSTIQVAPSCYLHVAVGTRDGCGASAYQCRLRCRQNRRRAARVLANT